MKKLEINLRKEAIKRCIEGQSTSIVAQELGRSKVWVCKWFKRYKEDPIGRWFEDQSRKPHSVPAKLDPAIEAQILRIREQLQSSKYSQLGALNIQYAFRQLQLPVPDTWTINRTLKRNNLIQHLPKNKKIKAYPEHYSHVQQIDFVGPRYIRDDGRFYSFNIIDVPTHVVGVYPGRSSTGEDALQGVVHFWKTVGIPDCIQMDNALCFRGSNRHPRSLNRFLRFILSQGVVPLFIPKGEPWRNGVIERFNNTFDKKFLRSQTFENMEHLLRETPSFTTFHNQHHRYTCLQGKNPEQVLEERSKFHIRLPEEVEPAKEIRLEGGTILFIFFLRSDCSIEILGSKFKINPKLQYSYITARLQIETHSITVERDNEIFQMFPFTMPVDW